MEPMGAHGPWANPQRWTEVAAENRGFTDLPVLGPPRGGPDGTPYYWGGVVL